MPDRRPVEVQADPVVLFGGILARMGEIMGTGAVYSLVHFGAVAEGRRLGLELGSKTPQECSAFAAALLHISMSAESRQARLTVKVQPGGALDTRDRAVAAMIVGLLEGLLGSATRQRYKVTKEPTTSDDGSMQFEMEA